MSSHTASGHAEQLRASSARIVAAADAERCRLECDLNNGPEQTLIVLGLKLGVVRRVIEQDPASAAAMIDELRAELDHPLAELRDLRHRIYPALLANEGLPAAVRDAVKRSAISVVLECHCNGRYPTEIESTVYFCCIEALQNVETRGGENPHAHIRIDERNRVVEFEVGDSGRELSSAHPGALSSTQPMTDRIHALGGTLKVDSATGHGVKLTGRIPIPDVA